MNSIKLLSSYLALGMAAIGLAACSSSDKPDIRLEQGPVKTKKAAEGWTRYTIEAAGIEVDFPEEWSAIDLTKEEFDEIIESGQDRNPDVQEMLRANAHKLKNVGIHFFAAIQDEKGKEQGFMTNANILTEELPTPASADEYLEAAAKQAGQLGAESIRTEKTSNGNQEIIVLKHISEMTVETGRQRLATYQYSVVSPDRACTLTLSTTADREAEFSGLFDAIGKTLRLMVRLSVR